MIRIAFFLIRIAVFIVALYIIYYFYKSLRKPTEKKVTEKTTACPSPKTFIDYTEGKIKGKKKKAIDDHIAHCNNCQNALKSVFNMPTEEESNEKNATPKTGVA